ncbi:hypothetical protein BpHYR1_044155 [Brachionus plicatilis]|uniref:Uncharacterized protein n=1 Tax=Brachionus plicatilis TaxID=10195 RepID=A0A3M7T199_BRAPC|nr:hypothetical protein BpHYR1_044155 [Brachionus plicatilis]
MPNQVMVRCFPAELLVDQITGFVDVLRAKIGPLRYARFIVEEDRSRRDTVGFISFYNLRDNQRCINTMSHRLQLILPHDKHYVQFKENHDYNHTAFDKWPHTQLRVYDIEEELIRYANEYPAERQTSPREENETSFNPDVKPSDNTKTGKASFLEKFYRSYLEKTSKNVVRLRTGKERTRRELLDELCELDPKYKHHKSEMSDWSLFRINSEINETWRAKKIEETGRAKKRMEEEAESEDTFD